MKKVIVMVIVLMLVGCGVVEELSTLESHAEQEKKKYRHVDYEYIINAGNVAHFTTNKGVDCIVIGVYRGLGLSCNWERYNRTQLLNNLKESTKKEK